MKLAEGKTKIIYRIVGSGDVLIVSKDDITAGDGARRHVISGKGRLATTTTINCFEFLRRRGIPTHFVNGIGPETFRAQECRMIPIELVARRIAAGSFLKRRPQMHEGMTLDPPCTEFFLKDDARHDPLIIKNKGDENWSLFDPKKPMYAGRIGRCPDLVIAGVDVLHHGVDSRLRGMALSVFEEFERAWAAQNVALVDMKIECGIDDDGILRVADVIDNDSWRIWPERDKSKMLDKQVYREMADPTPEDLEIVRRNYAQVAEMTAKFLE